MKEVATAFAEGFFGAIMLFLVLGSILICIILLLVFLAIALAAAVVLAPFGLIAALVMYYDKKKKIEKGLVP